MKHSNYYYWLFFFGFQLTSCQANPEISHQNPVHTLHAKDSSHKDEVTYFGITKPATSSDTSAAWNEKARKIMVTGTVYQPDGKTPASGVLIYYYHTNTEGKYVHNPDIPKSMPPNELGQTHGYIRGWIKTGIDGRYQIHTIKPGMYPTLDEPAHIHLTIKEPNDFGEYYIDDIVFDEDKTLSTKRRLAMENRGGSGVLRMSDKEGISVGERNIILGMNIPDHPGNSEYEALSGRRIGEDLFSFTPFHAWGPDKNTKTCPICKYGWHHGILYFVGKNPDWQDIKKWLTFLEKESIRREKLLKVFFIYGNESDYSENIRRKELEAIGGELDLKHIALTFVPGFSDQKSEIHLMKINPEMENTFILYKRNNVIDNFINLKPTQENFELLSDRLDQTINQYFYLSKPRYE